MSQKALQRNDTFLLIEYFVFYSLRELFYTF